MSDFKAKMYPIISAGAKPRPRWGAYSAPPDLLAGLRGPTKGREGEGKGSRRGRGREGTGRTGGV